MSLFSHLKRYWLIVLLVFLMLLTYTSGLHRSLSLEVFVDHYQSVQTFLRHAPFWAGCIFFAIYYAVVALSLPGAALLTVLGGWLFGAWVGGALTVFAATLGALTVFLAARTALGTWLKQNAGEKLGRLLAGFNKNSFSYLLFLRLVPLFPFVLVNLAPAFANMRLIPFVMATFLGIMPGTFAFSFAGQGLEKALYLPISAYRACKDQQSDPCQISFNWSDIVSPELSVGLLLLSAVALLPLLWRRRTG